jgi:hypothetical protein
LPPDRDQAKAAAEQIEARELSDAVRDPEEKGNAMWHVAPLDKGPAVDIRDLKAGAAGEKAEFTRAKVVIG